MEARSKCNQQREKREEGKITRTTEEELRGSRNLKEADHKKKLLPHQMGGSSFSVEWVDRLGLWARVFPRPGLLPRSLHQFGSPYFRVTCQFARGSDRRDTRLYLLNGTIWNMSMALN